MECWKLLFIFLKGFQNLVGLPSKYLQGHKDLVGLEIVYSNVNFSDKISFLKS